MARSRRGTGSVYRDADRNRWTGQITIDGRRRKVHARTKTEAQAKLSALLSSGAKLSTSQPTGSLIVAALLDEWIARDVQGRDLAPSTLGRHRWAVAKIAAVIGKRPIVKLTVADVEQALETIHEADELSRASLTKVLSSLKQALRYAVRRGYVERNVAADALVPAAARKPEQRSALEPDDARKLLVALRATPDGLRFGLSLRLGLRPGEAAALQWGDIDLEADTLTVNRARQLNQSGVPAIVDELKVESARRTIGLPPDVSAWITEHRARSGRLPTETALLFARSDGQPMHPTSDRAELTELCGAAGVPTVRPNELRHTAASLLIDDGVPIERVADLLGHNSTRMVDLTYRHRVRPVIDAAASATWAAAT